MKEGYMIKTRPVILQTQNNHTPFQVTLHACDVWPLWSQLPLEGNILCMHFHVTTAIIVTKKKKKQTSKHIGSKVTVLLEAQLLTVMWLNTMCRTDFLAYRVCVYWCHALTCFEEDDLIILTEVHEARDVFGKLHHILDCIGDVNSTLLPHHLRWLKETESFYENCNTWEVKCKLCSVFFNLLTLWLSHIQGLSGFHWRPILCLICCISLGAMAYNVE